MHPRTQEKKLSGDPFSGDPLGKQNDKSKRAQKLTIKSFFQFSLIKIQQQIIFGFRERYGNLA